MVIEVCDVRVGMARVKERIIIIIIIIIIIGVVVVVVVVVCMCECVSEWVCERLGM